MPQYSMKHCRAVVVEANAHDAINARRKLSPLDNFGIGQLVRDV